MPQAILTLRSSKKSVLRVLNSTKVYTSALGVNCKSGSSIKTAQRTLTVIYLISLDFTLVTLYLGTNRNFKDLSWLMVLRSRIRNNRFLMLHILVWCIEGMGLGLMRILDGKKLGGQLRMLSLEMPRRSIIS